MNRKDVEAYLQSGQNCHIHFVGIGGAGMSPIAMLVRRQGLTVSGSDLVLSDVTSRLSAEGIQIYEGHDRTHISSAELLVVTSAVSDGNPEVVEARKNGVPVISRAKMLGALMASYVGIGFAGTHGKTSSTSMAASVFSAAQMDPTVVVGGKPAGWNSNLRVGDSPYFLVEADESDGSFLEFPCNVVMVTNIDDDHMDFYGSMDKLFEYFIRFINQVGDTGCAFLCGDDENIRKMLPFVKVPYKTYGTSVDCDYVVSCISLHKQGTTFDLGLPDGTKLAGLQLNLSGRHYALNGAGCAAIVDYLGGRPDLICEGFASYRGVGRRSQFLGEKSGITIIDDYGHHPTEIEAVLKALKESMNGPVTVAFQPHRACRTFRLADRIARSLSFADRVFVLPVYEPAGGEKSPVDPSEEICRFLRKNVKTEHHYLKGCSLEDSAHWIAPKLTSGDTLITMGAGTITGLGPLIFDRI